MTSATMERKKGKGKAAAAVPEIPEDEKPSRPVSSCGVIQLENCSETHLRVDLLDRHPANRHPSPASVDALAESIGSVGLLEAVLVRKIGDRYQILSGETRWLAHRKAGAVLIRAKIVECGDAAALAVVAEANAKRTDLTTIERAQLIRQLCLPVDRGGSGMTRAQAAMVCGLESASAASNLIALLDAPTLWQEALVSGMKVNGHVIDVHEATVREIAKYSMCPKFQDALTKQFRDEAAWATTRDQQLRAMSTAVVQCARATKGKQYYGYQYGDHPCLLDLTDQKLRERLDIVELPLGAKGAMIECALNVKLWDELQIKEIKARGLDEESKRASRSRSASSKKTAAGQQLTPKEQAAAERAKRKEQDEQLARWAEEWQLRLLRCSMAGLIDRVTEVPWILPWLIQQSARDYRCPLADLIDYAAFASTPLYPMLSIGLADKPDRIGEGVPGAILNVRGESGSGLVTKAANSSQLNHRIARLILWPSDPDSDDESLVAVGIPEKLPYLDSDGLRRFAEAFEVSVEAAWNGGANSELPERALIKQLFSRHTGEQLDDLAAELGVELDAKGKAARVDQLLAAHTVASPLPLPKLLAGEKKRKGGA